MKPEQKFWELIKDHLPGDVSRVENNADDGTPDVTGAALGVDYWVELKVCDNLEKIVDPEKLLRPSQNVWNYRRVKNGSKIFIAVRYPNLGTIELYLTEKNTGTFYPVRYRYLFTTECGRKFNTKSFTVNFLNTLRRI